VPKEEHIISGGTLPNIPFLVMVFEQEVILLYIWL